MPWGYPGLSNTKKSPFYKAFSARSEGSIAPGAPGALSFELFICWINQFRRDYESQGEL